MTLERFCVADAQTLLEEEPHFFQGISRVCTQATALLNLMQYKGREILPNIFVSPLKHFPMGLAMSTRCSKYVEKLLKISRKVAQKLQHFQRVAEKLLIKLLSF